MRQVLSDDGKLLLDHLVVGLDLILSSKSLLDVTVQEAEGELGVGRVLVADADPEEVGNKGDNVVPVDDQEGISEVEGLSEGEVVQGDGLVGLDLIQSTSDGGRDRQVQGVSELGDNLNDLEEGGDDEGGEDNYKRAKSMRMHQEGNE